MLQSIWKKNVEGHGESCWDKELLCHCERNGIEIHRIHITTYIPVRQKRAIWNVGFSLLGQLSQSRNEIHLAGVQNLEKVSGQEELLRCTLLQCPDQRLPMQLNTTRHHNMLCLSSSLQNGMTWEFQTIKDKSAYRCQQLRIVAAFLVETAQEFHSVLRQDTLCYSSTTVAQLVLAYRCDFSKCFQLNFLSP